jgi:hypothetical protein
VREFLKNWADSLAYVDAGQMVPDELRQRLEDFISDADD